MKSADLSTPLRVESAPAPTELITSLGSLRALRTTKGLSITEVAARVKFPVRLIEALEAEQLDTLPRGLALQSLIRSYARLLDIDSKSIEVALRDKIGRVQGGIANHTSTRSLGAQDAQSVKHGGGWIWLSVIFLVVLAVFGIAIWQGLVPKAWVPVWLEALFK